MSPTVEDAESRRTSLNSETTLSDEAALSAPQNARLDKPNGFGTSATRASSRDSTATVYHDALSSLPDPDPEEPALQHGGRGPLDSPTLSVTVKRYEMLLSTHRSIIHAYRIVNDKLEMELLRTRELEVRAKRLRLELEEKDQQIAAREARVEALEERFQEGKEQRPAEEEGNDYREAANVAESESTAGRRETLMTEPPQRNLSACLGLCISIVLWVVMTRYLSEFCLELVRGFAR